MIDLSTLNQGDRVRVIASSCELAEQAIPVRFAGQIMTVANKPRGNGTVALHQGESRYYWYFTPELLEPFVPSPTIYATPRIATAQDLLHQLYSIHSQVKNLVGYVAPAHQMEDSLRRVIVEEIEIQTKEKSNGKK
jgi:hypothetical protein